MSRWHGPDTHWSSEEELRSETDQWRAQIRDTMQGVYLVELLIIEAPPSFRLDDVSQDSDLREESQVPYDEHWLSADGEHCLSADFVAPDLRPVRVAFYVHFFVPGDPLRGPWGALRLAEPSAVPERLWRIMPYSPPT